MSWVCHCSDLLIFILSVTYFILWKIGSFLLCRKHVEYFSVLLTAFLGFWWLLYDTCIQRVLLNGYRCKYQCKSWSLKTPSTVKYFTHKLFDMTCKYQLSMCLFFKRMLWFYACNSSCHCRMVATHHNSDYSSFYDCLERYANCSQRFGKWRSLPRNQHFNEYVLLLGEMKFHFWYVILELYVIIVIITWLKLLFQR